MRNYSNDYLSEFEHEFEMEFEGDTLAQELEGEQDSEYEDLENDTEYEYEDQEADNEFEDNEFELDSEGDLESRFYEVLNNQYESEFEFEQQLNELMHEAERDFFWKRWVRKIGKVVDNPLVKMALKFTPVGKILSAVDVVKAISQMSRGNLRGGLTQLLTNVIPGGNIVGKMAGVLQGEVGNRYSRGQIRDYLNIAQKAYENLADEISKVDRARSVQQVRQILRNAYKPALRDAIQTMRGSQHWKSGAGKRTVIRLRPGSKVLVTNSKVIIKEP